MQLRYVFSELGQGLRRNLSMHIAVVLTLFVSLTLVGLGVLLNQQADKAAQHWGSQLQITVWLCKDKDDNPACTGEVTDAQKAAIEKVVEENPEVAGYHAESKEEAFDKVKELLGPEKFEGPNPAATAADMPQSLWIELKDPEEYQGITSAVKGLDGVSGIRDMRAVLKPIYGSINALQWGALGTATFLVLAALLLVGNTIRLAAFARRREIGIMRLVGASTLYITLPFLLEALVTALIGVGARRRGARRLHVLRHPRACGGPAEVHAVDRDAGVHRRDRLDRDPRSDPHPASDTRADPQIPQSLSVAGYRRAVHFPEHRRQTGALLPPYRTPSPRGGLRGLHDGGRRAGRPARERDRPQAPAGAGAGPDQVGRARPRGLEPAAAAGGRRGSRSARAELADARAELAARAAKLDAAQLRDREMQARLETAIARLADAQADLATGQQALADQRVQVTSTITAIYEEGDPELLAFASLLDAQTPADLATRMEARNVIVGRETRAYDDLHAAEVLLEVRENEVQAAKDDVAVQRRAAAEHLVTMQQLVQETRAAKAKVRQLVDRAAAGPPGRGPGPAARPRRPRPAARAREQDQGSGSSRQARRAAARNPDSGYRGDTGGFLSSPVNGSVTSPFGYREHPIYHYRAMHDGTDFGAGCGQPLYAVGGGTVMAQVLLGQLREPPLPQPRHGQRQEPHRDLQPPLRLRRRRRSAGRAAARSSGTSAAPAGPPAATSTSR